MLLLERGGEKGKDTKHFVQNKTGLEISLQKTTVYEFFQEKDLT